MSSTLHIQTCMLDCSMMNDKQKRNYFLQFSLYIYKGFIPCVRCVHLILCIQTNSCQINLLMHYLISIYGFHHTSEWRKHVSYETAGRTVDTEGTWEKSPISIIEGHFHHARGTFPFSDLTIQKRGSYLRERVIKMENLTFRLYI